MWGAGMIYCSWFFSISQSCARLDRNDMPYTFHRSRKPIWPWWQKTFPRSCACDENHRKTKRETQNAKAQTPVLRLRMPATHKVHQVLCLPLKTQRDLEGKQQRIAKSLRTLEKCNSSTIQDFKMYFCKTSPTDVPVFNEMFMQRL